MLPSFLALPPEELALLRLIADETARRDLPAYVVGGFVRDLLLGHPGPLAPSATPPRRSFGGTGVDFDVVVEGDAVALARTLAKKHGGKITAHPRFGTATWKVDNSIFDVRSSNIELSTIDLITARRERYSRPAALPDVTPSSLEDDIRRRDFTINTLAVRLDGQHFGQLYDICNGAADLKQGLVRVLHDASFIDDPTRMFRAARYEVRYGFKIEPHTLQLFDGARPLVSRLSAERVRHELDLAFDEPRAAAVLARLGELGLLKAVSHALPWGDELRQRLESALDVVPAPAWEANLPSTAVPFRWLMGYSLWLLDLSAAEIDQVQSRLSFPAVVLNTVRAAAALRADLPGLRGQKPSKWVQRLEAIPLPAVYALYLASREAALETYVARWQLIRPETDGQALKAMGVPPGPAYKKILLRLRAAWLDGEVASAEQEKALLEKLLAT